MATRDEYVEATKRTLDEWNRQIDDVEARIAQTSGETRKDLERKLEQARQSYDAARRKLDEVRKAGEAAWTELQKDAEHVADVFERSVKYFRSQL